MVEEKEIRLAEGGNQAENGNNSTVLNTLILSGIVLATFVFLTTIARTDVRD